MFCEAHRIMPHGSRRMTDDRQDSRSFESILESRFGMIPDSASCDAYAACGISGERARSCATAAAVSLSRFSSYSGMPLSRQRNGISSANKISDIR